MKLTHFEEYDIIQIMIYSGNRGDQTVNLSSSLMVSVLLVEDTFLLKNESRSRVVPRIFTGMKAM